MALFHRLYVLVREKTAIGTHPLRALAARVLHRLHQRHQQPIVIAFLTDLLGHNEMIVAHRYRRRIAQCESCAVS